ncbi:MAG TPA: HD domain-containing protein [Coriobacteriia bacterium]|nr:HD domain-containing protein [Coriobacteriia bacterium]
MGVVEKIPVPKAVEQTAQALASRGYDAVLVGGAVRDALLGTESSDYDLVTEIAPETMREVLAEVDGIRGVYALGERFGTVGAALEAGGTLEITQYRPDALAFASTDERFTADAGHRDFTVNAMGYDFARSLLLDPTGGRADLDAKLLRTPGAPTARFAEDPIRVLRAARFVAELGFSLHIRTAEAMEGHVEGLADVAPERIRDELTKLLVGRFAADGLRVARDSGALLVVLPEVAALDGVSQPSFHDLDVLAHTIASVEGAPPTRVLRWATLLHDVGKAPARTVEESGRIRFFRHAQIGAEIAGAICRRLRMSNADTAAIVHLVAEHMRLGEVNLESARSVDRAVRKLDLRVDATPGAAALVSAEDAVALTLADFGATAHRAETPRLAAALERAVRESRERGTHEAVRSPVSGRWLMHHFGLERGPKVGVAKSAIERAIESGELSADDIDGALQVARAALQRAGH